MFDPETSASFSTPLLTPAKHTDGEDWSFIILPREASELLPRRGRTTVDGELNGVRFQAVLEPDGNQSHWLKVSPQLRDAAGVSPGESVALTVAPAAEQAEPQVPEDLQQALGAHPNAHALWQEITTLARIDWIHWIETAKRAATRAKRIQDACNMLSEGKRNVCCFDPSGFYSKAFGAPRAAE